LLLLLLLLLSSSSSSLLLRTLLSSSGLISFLVSKVVPLVRPGGLKRSRSLKAGVHGA
jgi:hypothetical protein